MVEKNSAFNKHRQLVILIIITLAFIWGNSILPACVSAGISGSLMRFICSLTSFASTGDVSDGHLRKFAHAFEFACLGTELIMLVRCNIKKYISSAILFGLTTALIDETIQLFSEGRSSQVKDIWIDMLGFFIGTIITLTALKHIRTKRKQKLFDMELSVNERGNKNGK